MKNFYQLWRFLTEMNPPQPQQQGQPQQGQPAPQPAQGQPAQGQPAQAQPAQGQQGQAQGQPDQATQQKVAQALQQNPAAAQALQNDPSLQVKLHQAVMSQGPNADIAALINSLVPQQGNPQTGPNTTGGGTGGVAMNQ